MTSLSGSLGTIVPLSELVGCVCVLYKSFSSEVKPLRSENQLEATQDRKEGYLLTCTPLTLLMLMCIVYKPLQGKEESE